MDSKGVFSFKPFFFFCSSMPGDRSKKSGQGGTVEDSCKKGVLIENWPKNPDHKK